MKKFWIFAVIAVAIIALLGYCQLQMREADAPAEQPSSAAAPEPASTTTEEPSAAPSQASTETSGETEAAATPETSDAETSSAMDEAKAAADAAAEKAKQATDAAAAAAAAAAKAAEEEAAKAAAEAERVARDAAEAAEEEARRAAEAAREAAEKAGEGAGKALEEAGKALDQAAEDAEKALENAGKLLQGAGEAAERAAEDAENAARKALEDARKALEGGNDAPQKPNPNPNSNERDARLPETPPGGDGAGAASGLAGQTEGAPKQHDTAPPRKPTFDVAQVEGNGDAIVAGTAAPGDKVRLKSSDGRVLGESVAGPDGSFTILTQDPLPEGDSVISLETENGDGAKTAGAESLVVSRQGDGPPLVVAQGDTADAPARVLQQPAPPKPSTLAGAATQTGDKPEAGDEAVKTSDGPLQVGSVDYDEKGRLAVQGKAEPGADVTLEVDGKPVATAKADAKGDWQAATPPGTADAVGRIGATAAGGGRVFKISLPFAPQGLVKEFPRGRLVVVQPGNSLWRIARRTYGAGLRYTVIYAANQDQISNPDLIYPGQIFHAPTGREG